MCVVFLVPIVLFRREPAPNHVVALLVEEYLTFVTSRPGYVVDSGSDVCTCIYSSVTDV